MNKVFYKTKLSTALIFILVIINAFAQPNITNVFAATTNIIAVDKNYKYIIYKDPSNTVHINDKTLSRDIVWEGIYYLGDSGAYKRRTQKIECYQSGLDWNNVEFGSYSATSLGKINNVFRVKVMSSAKYTYYFSEFDGSSLVYSFLDVLGNDTPRYTDSSDDPIYLIINADTGKVIDLDWKFNFYYYKGGVHPDGIEKRTFTKASLGDYNAMPVPDIPTSITATPSSKSNELTWTPAPRAVSYDIEIDGTVISNVYTTKYVHQNLTFSSEHTYRVRAVNPNGVSDWSDEIRISTLLNIPSNIKTISTSNGINLSWDSVDEATGYDIQVDGTVYDNGSSLNYLHNGLLPNSSHTYRIRGKNNDVLGEWSSLLTIYTAPDLPQNVSAVHSNSAVKISWSAQNGATGYNILIDDLIYNTTGLTYTYNTTENHDYKLRSYNTAGASDWINVNLTTVAPNVNNISVINNKVGMDDIVNISGLVEGDQINIYNAATGGILLGTGIVSTGDDSITINIPQIGTTAGKIYVSAVKSGDVESARTAQTFTSETSAAPAATAITVVNNYIGTDDTVKVTGLAEGDIINVYNAATGGTLLGTGTVESGNTELTIAIPQLGSTAGNVYVSVTKVNKLESTRTTKAYAVEPTTTSPAAATISVVNNKAGIDDTVKVTGLVEGDLINVYSAATGGTLLGSGTVGSGENSIIITIPQVGAGSGSVYVSIKKEGKLESARTAQTFTSETSAAPAATAITVVNNYIGTDDTVKVTGLAEGDIINVYNAATGGSLLGTGTVESGNTELTIAIPQLGSTAGNVYVSVTKVNKLESARTAKNYLVEPIVLETTIKEELDDSNPVDTEPVENIPIDTNPEESVPIVTKPVVTDSINIEPIEIQSQVTETVIIN